MCFSIPVPAVAASVLTLVGGHAEIVADASSATDDGFAEAAEVIVAVTPASTPEDADHGRD